MLEEFIASDNVYLAYLNCDCGWADDAAVANQAFRELLQRRSISTEVKTIHQRSCGICDALSGDICKLRGEFENAEKLYRSALTTFERISDAYQQTRCHYRLGRLYLSANRPVDAEAALLKARPGYLIATSDKREDILLVRDLARLDLYLAKAKMQIGKHAEVEPILTHAIDVLTGLSKDCPEVHDFHAQLGFGYQLRADLYRHNGQADRAADWTARADAAKAAALKINPVRLMD